MIKKAIRKSYPILFVTLLFALTGAVLQLRALYITKDLVDNALSIDRSIDFLKINAVKMVIWSAFSIFFVLVGNFFQSLYYRKAVEYAKTFYLKTIFKKKINEFQAENTAKYFSNLTNDMERIENEYIMSLYEILYMIFQALISVGVLLYVNYVILIAGIAVGLIFAVMAALMGIPMQKHEKQLSDILGKYTEYVKEILSAFQIIKTNNLQKKASDDFYHKSKNVEDKEFFVGKLSSYILLILISILLLLVLGIILGGIYLVYLKIITVGTLLFALSPMTRIVNSFGNVGGQIQAIVGLKKVFETIDDNLKNSDTYEETIELSSFDSSIEFKNVSFNYGENEVLKDVGLKFEKGKKYLIVGPSGGGKTTVLKLLRKYFNPTGGEILVDGKNLKDITPLSYFKNIANIEQQVFLFEDSLYNNITLYKNYSQDEIKKVVKNAGLSSFVENLSGGLDYKITDNGKNISGGEKARIAIARGLITRAKLIFLDEAFASLDMETAIRIEETLLALKDVTVINVSHVVFDKTRAQYDNIITVKNKGVELS
ncbi:ABC transporter ATP-binding protein [Treponema sp. OMZ 792]|uniref:ABC transporter ATP-binding protein n=1 Tax=unclassified Treponema TaxID=2638727 RepID=UPI0020A612CE|nr:MULTISPECIES: ABC transporter ATP-binding protein [unclassified Treponema]UTC76271.1 ABC transporter ATP-binding protein [Treponema sp. OMZ 792]UTC80271.1 ABC transporter ATP-binding protein [Treponema sp. OMZ 798]